MLAKDVGRDDNIIRKAWLYGVSVLLDEFDRMSKVEPPPQDVLELLRELIEGVKEEDPHWGAALQETYKEYLNG